MKNWTKIIVGLIILGIVLFLLGKFSPMKAVTWLTAIIGIVVGVGGLFYADVNWGRFLDQTL